MGSIQVVGNDIIDLHPNLTDLSSRSQRFLHKIGSPRECSRWQNSIVTAPNLIWHLWALKEAAFKACSQIDPHIPFQPKKFEVDSLLSRVSYGKWVLKAKLQTGDRFVHAVVTNGPWLSVHWATLQRHYDHINESATVRQLAISLGQKVLNCQRISITISYRAKIPIFRVDCERLFPLSLSHHGSFVAAALSTKSLLEAEKSNATCDHQ